VAILIVHAFTDRTEHHALFTANALETLTNTVYLALLTTIGAAVLGVIASLAVWFAVHVLFAGSTAWRWPWGGSVWLPDPTSLDLITTAIALAAGVALIRFKANVVLVILACALAGLVRWWLS